MKETRYAYVAGLIDADGCFGISRCVVKGGYISYDPTIRVRSTHLPTIKWLVNTFGGTFSHGKWENDDWKDYYLWKFSSDVHASRFLDKILPYLWLKQAQGLVLREYFAMNGAMSPSKRETLYTEMIELNQSESLTTNTSRLSLTGKLRHAYFSGVIDGEGSFYVIKGNQSSGKGVWYRAAISLGNTCKPLVVSLKEEYGGAWRKRPPHNGVLPMYQLDIQDNASKEKLLLYTLPYLVTKREQAKLVLNFVRIRVANPVLRAEYFVRCGELNGKKIEPVLIGDYESERTVMCVS